MDEALKTRKSEERWGLPDKFASRQNLEPFSEFSNIVQTTPGKLWIWHYFLPMRRASQIGTPKTSMVGMLSPPMLIMKICSP